jgi:hypothetical protein
MSEPGAVATGSIWSATQGLFSQTAYEIESLNMIGVEIWNELLPPYLEPWAPFDPVATAPRF